MPIAAQRHPVFFREKSNPRRFIGGHGSSLITIMNAKTGIPIVLALGICSLTAPPAVAGVGVGVQINVPAPVVVAPPPAVILPAVPDSYVWDGAEYVGVV